MAVIEGGTYGPGDTFPDGTIFIGCTLKSPCVFGEGCIFTDCQVIRDERPRHTIGAGASMAGGFVENTNFGEAAQLGGTSVGRRVSFSADSKVDGGIVTQTGAAISYEGNAAQGSTKLSPDWCTAWACKPPYANVTISGIVNAPVKVTDAGTVYEIPSSG